MNISNRSRFQWPGLGWLCVCVGLSISTRLVAFPVEISQGPQNDLALSLRAIQTARQSIFINIYEFKSVEVANALIAQIRNGIHVEILEEGQPVGGFSSDEADLRDRILAEMERVPSRHNRYLIMSSKETRKKRRYRFDHAKYMVIDGARLLVGSENYSESSHPTASKPGNRGWEVMVYQPALTSQFKTLWDHDSSLSFGDVHDLTARTRRIGLDGLPGLLGWSGDLPWSANSTAPRGIPSGQNPTYEASTAQQIYSPETSLQGLTALIRSAKRSLDLEMMTFNPFWTKGTKASPLLVEIAAAARRGVRVRALLNDESVFEHGHPGPRYNEQTVKALKNLASKEHLNVDAKIADLSAMKVSYIHNKGLLVDGTTVLISSINWNENSVTNNRETAVALYSPAACQYYAARFEADWNVSR